MWLVDIEQEEAGRFDRRLLGLRLAQFQFKKHAVRDSPTSGTLQTSQPDSLSNQGDPNVYLGHNWRHMLGDQGIEKAEQDAIADNETGKTDKARNLTQFLNNWSPLKEQLT